MWCNNLLCCCKCCICIPESNLAVVEHCGKYSHVATPGFYCLTPCRDKAKMLSLRLQLYTFKITGKTKDNIFVTCDISVNTQIIPDAVVNACYSCQSAQNVIEAYLQHSLRSKITLYSMEELYMERNTIASQCKEELDSKMERYGFDITHLLIVEVEPDKRILQMLSEIQCKKYKKQSAQDAADARKIRTINAAEAYAEASKLKGEGLAAQRKAIVDGLQGSVSDFKAGVDSSVTSEDVMSLLLVNQYYDMLKTIGDDRDGVRPTIVLNHEVGLREVAEEMEQGVIHRKHK